MRLLERIFPPASRARFAAQVIRPAFRPYADGLTIELVLDYPDSVAILGAEQLEKWNVSFDDALAVARENLWRLSNKDFAHVPDGPYVSTWHDSHDASRLFLHDLL